MDTTNTQQYTDEITSFEEALASTPEEVRRFIWSEAFDIILDAITATYQLNAQQSAAVRTVAIETVIGIGTSAEKAVTLFNTGISDDTAEQVFAVIKNEIVDRAVAQAELYQGYDVDTQETSPVAPNSDVLSTLGSRLSQSSVIAPPTKRDYSLDKSTTPPAQPRATDSYREKVDL